MHTQNINKKSKQKIQTRNPNKKSEPNPGKSLIK